jgi:hypothetical protein
VKTMQRKEGRMAVRELTHTLGPRTACVWRRIRWFTLGMITLGMGAGMAQTFNSGSTGADGAWALSSTPPGTVVEFNPLAFTPVLDADGDSVYHFTTITLPEGVTVRLRADKAGAAPLHWLATDQWPRHASDAVSRADAWRSHGSVPLAISLAGCARGDADAGAAWPGTPCR